MSQVKYELVRILQNILRIVITGAPLIYLIWAIGDATGAEQPLWVTIMLGSILGGCVFLPAKDIGDSIWIIVTSLVERALGKPEIEDECASPSRLEAYSKWKCEIRKATLFEVGRRTLIPSLSFSTLFVAVLGLIPVLCVALFFGITRPDSLETIALNTLAYVIGAVILALGMTACLVVVSTLFLKLYLNNTTDLRVRRL